MAQRKRLRYVFGAGLAVVLFSFTSISSGQANPPEDLSVFSNWRMYAGAKNALYNDIAGRAYRMLDARERALAGLTTKAQWRARVAQSRARLRDAFGPFPARTPLNARITGSFEYRDVSVEHVTFESRPGFTVTGSFFKPAGSAGKLPAILYLCGHSDNGYRSDAYQLVILNLARKGFAVFAIDPIGQGERLQYFDPEKGKSRIGGPTSEHSYAGMQYLPTGHTLAMVRVWDAMRALDYLAERPDVDMTRIGAQGRSGGGTLSAYLGAMDDRVTAAAPECYITSFRRLFESIGPQDAEQNLLAQISSGLDHGDFLLARAPKPTLVVTTTRDMFSIQGARETVASVKPAFAALGDAGDIGMIEDDAPHQSTKLNRERVYAFFMKHLGVSGSAADETIPPIDAAKLRVTPGGQAALLPGAKTAHDFSREEGRVAIDALDRSRANAAAHRDKVMKAAPAFSGMRPDTAPLETVFAGRYVREGCSIEKYIIGADRPIPVPALVFVPDGAPGKTVKLPAVLWFNGTGKAADAAPGGRLEALARAGYLVLAADLPGIGELGGDSGGDSVIRGVNYNLVFGAQLVGGSVTGIQADAILRCLRALLTRADADPGRISAVATGIAGPALLHAALAEPRMASVALVNAPLSWESILDLEYYDQALGMTVVPSALTRYDLPDLMGNAAKRVLALDPVGGDGKSAPAELRDRTAKTVALVRGTRGGTCEIAVSESSGSADDMLREWLGKGE